MSKVPSKSGLVKPSNIRVTRSITDQVPGSSRTETIRKTVESSVPSSCTNRTCEGPCSSAKLQPPSQQRPAPQRRQPPAPPQQAKPPPMSEARKRIALLGLTLRPIKMEDYRLPRRRPLPTPAPEEPAMVPRLTLPPELQKLLFPEAPPTTAPLAPTQLPPPQAEFQPPCQRPLEAAPEIVEAPRIPSTRSRLPPPSMRLQPPTAAFQPPRQRPLEAAPEIVEAPRIPSTRSRLPPPPMRLQPPAAAFQPPRQRPLESPFVPEPTRPTYVSPEIAAAPRIPSPCSRVSPLPMQPASPPAVFQDPRQQSFEAPYVPEPTRPTYVSPEIAAAPRIPSPCSRVSPPPMQLEPPPAAFQPPPQRRLQAPKLRAPARFTRMSPEVSEMMPAEVVEAPRQLPPRSRLPPPPTRMPPSAVLPGPPAPASLTGVSPERSQMIAKPTVGAPRKAGPCSRLAPPQTRVQPPAADFPPPFETPVLPPPAPQAQRLPLPTQAAPQAGRQSRFGLRPTKMPDYRRGPLETPVLPTPQASTRISPSAIIEAPRKPAPSSRISPSMTLKPAPSLIRPHKSPVEAPVLPTPAKLPGVSPKPSTMIPKEIIEAPRKAAPASRLPALPMRLKPPSALKPSTSTLEDNLGKTLKERTLLYPGQKQVVKAQEYTKLCRPQFILTPAGREEVIQKAVLEKRVERDEEGEKIVKTVSISEKDDSGVVQKNTLGIQQFDPDYPKSDGGKEIVGIISTVSVTPSYKTVSQECIRLSLEPEINMSPQEVAHLVEEEKEDVENTLKMVPPDLELEPGSFELKQRQQRLRLHSESMALLEQSIIQPTPTADESQAEPTPEAMATMMHTVENGISPQSEPDQVFNTLFEETTNEQFIKVSSVTPGPLQDVVIPAEVPKEVHMEVLSDNMAQLTEKMNTRVSVEEAPYVDIFTKVMNEEQKLPKGKNKPKSFYPIQNQKSLWVNANLEHLVNVIGAEPAEVVDPYNLDELLESENLEQELSNGIDYFVQADPIQYVSRVQLRGTQMPAFFPGYMVAIPDFPEIIKIARSPDEVYASAWKAVQPKYFEDENLINMSF